jgi:hypothetical protein
MSFKRFDPEDIVLSSELITFPTWYTQKAGDTSRLDMVDAVRCPEQGFSEDYYKDFYSIYVPPTSSDEESEENTGSFDEKYSKALFSLAYATRPEDRVIDFTPTYGYVEYTTKDEEGHYVVEPGVTYYTKSVDPETGEVSYEPVTPPDLEDEGEYYTKETIWPVVYPSEIVFGQYRSLVLGDEDSDFRFGNTKVDADNTEAYADSFIAMSIDRARFREKLDPSTCRILLAKTDEEGEQVTLAPDISANKRYLDAGRVFDLARYTAAGEYKYPEKDENGAATSYGYFLPDIGVILFNTSNTASLYLPDGTDPDSWAMESDKVTAFKEQLLVRIDLRSQETVTSNFVFVRARNAEFNYSTNPSNITGSAGNIRHDVMINQPQSFITTVGLYNDANELLAVAKLSRPLIKDFTKEALIRVKLDY